MQVDLGTLVWERRVAMHNVPLGTVQIHLSGKDMGNFVSHPLFKQAADTAVQVCRMPWCLCAQLLTFRMCMWPVLRASCITIAKGAPLLVA